MLLNSCKFRAEVIVEQGVLAGCLPDLNGISAFLGVRYAAPPTGSLRFERPKPAAPWSGISTAGFFGPRCIQRAPFADVHFRSTQASEDCLFINIWTPAPGDHGARLPVLIYLHGGAFIVGDGSEPRYDGSALASRGVVVVTFNTRLGIFGFFAHPELPSANVALHDFAAVVDWIATNIAGFGGDPGNITVGGSSSGAFAACAVAAYSDAGHKISGVFAQSAALLGAKLGGLCTPLPLLEEVQEKGAAFSRSIGICSIQELKALPAERLLSLSSPMSWNRPCIDGAIFAADLRRAFSSASRSAMSLMIGMTSAEPYFQGSRGFRPKEPEEFRHWLQGEFGPHAELIFSVYGAPKTQVDTALSARDLATDRWIGRDNFHIACAAAEAGHRVYSYVFDQIRPDPSVASGGWTSEHGAAHSMDIEYFLGTQGLIDVYNWTEEDKELSRQMQAYLTGFLRNGQPDVQSLRNWPEFIKGQQIISGRTGGLKETRSIRDRIAALDLAGG